MEEIAQLQNAANSFSCILRFFFKFRDRVNVNLRGTADKHYKAGDGWNKVSLELEIWMMGARCLWLAVAVVCSQAPNNSSIPSLLGVSWGGVLEGVPAGSAEGF